MATQKISVDSFYGGMANTLAPHLLGKDLARTAINYMVDKGTLFKVASLDNTVIVPAGSDKQFHYNSDNIIVDDIIQHPVYFQGNMYVLDGGVPKQVRGSSLVSTIVSNFNLDAITISGGTTGDNNKYYVTWENTAGFESPMVYVGEYKGYSLTIANIPTLAGSKVRLYRIGAREKHFALISKDLANGTLNKEYGDDVASSPAKHNPPIKFEYLQAHRLGLAASAGNNLYLSALRPDAWDTFASLNLASHITGIAAIDRGLIIFTETNYVYSLVGTDLTNIKLDLINTEIGCDSHHSIARLRNGLVAWVFENDVYTFGGSFNNVTRGRYKVDFKSNAVAFMNRYILLDYKGLLTIDFGIPVQPVIRYNFAISDMVALQIVYVTGKKPRLLYYSKDNSGKLLDINDKNYTRFGIGDYPQGAGTVDESEKSEIGIYPGGVSSTSFEEGILGDLDVNIGQSQQLVPNTGIYHSGDFYANTYDSESTFNSIDLVHRGEVIVTLYVDNNAVSTNTVTRASKGVSRVMYPASGNRGAYTSVKLEFNEEVYNYSISIEATPIT